MSAFRKNLRRALPLVSFAAVLSLVVFAVATDAPKPPAPEVVSLTESALEIKAAADKAVEIQADVTAAIPPYPSAIVIPMGELSVNGYQMRMMAFRTEHPYDAVLDYYEMQFRRRGHHVERNEDSQHVGGNVSYYDSERGAMIGVTVTTSATGQRTMTLGFPTVTHAPQGVHLAGDSPKHLPQPKDAVTLVRVVDKTPGPSLGSSTITQLAPGTPRMLADYFMLEMKDRGYETVSGREQEQVQLLEFTKADERVSLTISPVAEALNPESTVAMVIEKNRPETVR